MKRKNRSYSIVDDNAVHPNLKKYCELPIVKQAYFNEKYGKHSYVTADNRERLCNGLHSYIKLVYLPAEYKQPSHSDTRLRCIVGNSATKEIGIGVSSRIEEVVENNGKRCHLNSKNISWEEQKIMKYSDKILDWLEEQNYELQAAELPIVMEKISRMTRVDLITLDRRKTGLIAWEIKTGWPPGAVYDENMFKSPLQTIQCSAFNKWFIQSLYTNAGLAKLGLTTVCIKVLHCWEYENLDTQKLEYKVASRDLPSWAVIHEKKILSSI